MTINLLNDGLMPMPATASLRETPMRTPGAGKVLWTDKLANANAVCGPVARGTRLYLSIQFNDVMRPNYWWPAPGESIQADLLVDGKMVKRVVLDAESFNDPANYFLADETQTNLVQEVEVEI